MFSIVFGVIGDTSIADAARHLVAQAKSMFENPGLINKKMPIIWMWLWWKAKESAFPCQVHFKFPYFSLINTWTNAEFNSIFVQV